MNHLLYAANEIAQRKNRVHNEPVPLDELFRALFGMTLTELRKTPGRGDLARVSREMARILRLDNPLSLKFWHGTDEAGAKTYFSEIPKDRLATLVYYYHSIMPHASIRL